MIGWTSAPGFRRELTPSWLVVACLLAGQRPPDFTRPFRVAYLGAGPGITAAVTAAAHPDAEVWAWGLRPEDVETTRRLRDAAALDNLVIHERPGLPSDLGGDVVDLMVVNQLLDSCDDDMRSAVVNAMAASLRPGGIAAVSYRTTVGWSEITPVLAVMRRAADRAAGDDVERAERALELVRTLRLGGARHLSDRPWVASWLDELVKTEPSTIAAEYLRLPLRPISHAWLDEALAPMRPTFVGSARVTDDLLAGVPEHLVELIRNAASPLLREAYRDLANRPKERLDIFRRATATLGERERRDALDDVVLHDLTGQEDPPTVSVRELGDDEHYTLVRTLLDAGEAMPSISHPSDKAMARAARLDAVLTHGGRW
jgi:hypothetical protein